MVENLRYKKRYVDTKFGNPGVEQQLRFKQEVASFNATDGVVGHVGDIVAPVSWSTVYDRGNQ